MPPSVRFPRPHALLAALLSAAVPALAADAPRKSNGSAVATTRSDDPLVEVTRACPGVIVELRYASPRNITGKPIYPPGARALLRRSVAERLNRAQQFLQDRGFGLKVWDAYRPAAAHRQLWNAVRNPAYVVAPGDTGSLHGWGAAVDVTLVDFRGREARMPTDFDAFNEAARYDYRGKDPEVAFNLSTLKRAMAEAGFRHIRDEWWHFSVTMPGYGPIDAPLARQGEEIARADDDAAAGKKKLRGNGRLLFPPRAGETL